MVAGVREIQKRLKMTDGFDLFCRHWKTLEESKKTVICIHGVGGHSGVFRVIGQDLAEDGIEVYGLDLRGFRQLEGRNSTERRRKRLQ